MLNFPIYLDNNSTTRTDPKVVEKMLPYFSEKFGNPASRSHIFGIEASAAVEFSREIVAKSLNAEPDEIIFTSGATESINLAIRGITEANFTSQKNTIITTPIEHSASNATIEALSKYGVIIKYLPVDKYGMIDIDHLDKTIDKSTLLVSIIHANNEIGTVQNMFEIANICEENNIALHLDSTQAISSIKIDTKELKADLISFSGHKIYGPKGIGVLFINRRLRKTKVSPIITGGNQEKGLRSGTLNVPAIVGLSEAIRILEKNRQEEFLKISELNRVFWEIISSKSSISVSINGALPCFQNGNMIKRIPNNLNLRFDGIFALNILREAKELALSTSSACSSSDFVDSHVLKAIGLNKNEIKSSFRVGFGRFNSLEEINFSANRIVEIVENLK